MAAKISRVLKLKKVAGGNCKVAGALSHCDKGGPSHPSCLTRSKLCVSHCDKGGPVIPCQLILLKPSVVAFKVLQNGIVCFYISMSTALITHDPTKLQKMLQR